MIDWSQQCVLRARFKHISSSSCVGKVEFPLPHQIIKKQQSFVLKSVNKLSNGGRSRSIAILKSSRSKSALLFYGSLKIKSILIFSNQLVLFDGYGLLFSFVCLRPIASVNHYLKVRTPILRRFTHYGEQFMSTIIRVQFVKTLHRSVKYLLDSIQ